MYNVFTANIQADQQWDQIQYILSAYTDISITP